MKAKYTKEDFEAALKERCEAYRAEGIDSGKIYSAYETAGEVVREAIEKYLEDGVESNIESHGKSVEDMRRERPRMTYLAAALNVAWIMRDGEVAVERIEKGWRRGRR